MPRSSSALRAGSLSPGGRSARAGDARDLGDRRDAAPDLLEAVLAQAHHALADRLVGDRVGRLAGHGHLADRLGDRHDLIEADAALVAGAAAAGAAHGLVALEVEADVEAVGAQHLRR